MRNRTLMRPMFRIGGSAGTGITSGLDKPRTNYQFGGGADARRFIQRPMTPQAPAVDRKPTGLGMGTLPGFLTQFGLNLLSTPSTGNIFSTAATAAREPFSSFLTSKAKQAATADERAFQEKLLERQIASDEAIAAMKQKDSFFAAQTPEEQFRERAKIYSESAIPVIKNNATDLANFEVKNRGENYVQLNFEYDKKTKQFEPDFRSVPEGALTYDPGKGIAYRMTRREDGALLPIPLNPFTLEPLKNIDGSES
tara:strand:- start:26 stop:787 length:762 start_codon:yes stop_codon:yes gene_type:complete